MYTRTTFNVYDVNGKNIGNIHSPMVFNCPIRPDLVAMVHSGLSKNKRQPYAVSSRSGHKNAAKSWGTGRALARIPRLSAGGTHRSGQAAIGNMCRGGHMSAPTKIWRRWHQKINLNIKRYAMVSALAASAFPSLVMARGHRIDNVPETPLALDDAIESVSNTSKALSIGRAVGCISDIKRPSASHNIGRGRRKMRNRRYVSFKGPMVIYAGNYGIARAFRNLPVVEVANVKTLNIIKLAPGGIMGRFLIWTKPAMESLSYIFGSFEEPSKVKKGYFLPRPRMKNSALNQLINSDEIQSSVRAPKKPEKYPSRNSRRLIKLSRRMINEIESKIDKAQGKSSKSFYKEITHINDKKL